MSSRRLLPAALFVPALLLAGPGHDHGTGPHESKGHQDHEHEADAHGVTPRFGGQIFEAKGHHFEVVLQAKTLILVPRDAHTHDLSAIQGKVMIQVEGGAPRARALAPRASTAPLPAHLAAQGDVSALRQHGAKALVVIKGLADTGKRGLSFWIHLEERDHADHDGHGHADHDDHDDHGGDDGHSYHDDHAKDNGHEHHGH